MLLSSQTASSESFEEMHKHTELTQNSLLWAVWNRRPHSSARSPYGSPLSCSQSESGSIPNGRIRWFGGSTEAEKPPNKTERIVGRLVRLGRGWNEGSKRIAQGDFGRSFLCPALKELLLGGISFSVFFLKGLLQKLLHQSLSSSKMPASHVSFPRRDDGRRRRGPSFR